MSALREVTIPEANGCLVCLEPFTAAAPATHSIPMRNREAGVKTLVPVHEACADRIDHHGDDALLDAFVRRVDRVVMELPS